MKTSDQIESRIVTLKIRRERLARALENMDSRIFDAESLRRKALEKEKPQKLVKHIETVGTLSTWTYGVEYHVKVEVNGKECTYLSLRRPRVLNAKLRVTGSIEFTIEGKTVLTTAPRIQGGKIWIKEYFIDQLLETPSEPEKNQGLLIERRVEENPHKEPENSQEDVR